MKGEVKRYEEQGSSGEEAPPPSFLGCGFIDRERVLSKPPGRKPFWYCTAGSSASQQY